MHKKVNVDYFKNKLDKLPSVQLPKIKSRKVFSTKNSTESLPPPLPKVPPPTIVDRSPVCISTISSLVEGAPKYDYSFGGAEVPKETIQRHLKEDIKRSESESNIKRTKGFSEKLTKQYRELSEFKFKNIFGKKTIVQRTEIQVDLYKQRYGEDLDEHSSEQSDYDFDFHSISVGNDRRTSVTASLQSQESISHIPQKAESLQSIDEIQPIESSLFKIKQRAETISSDNISPKEIEENTKKSHREVFDSACERAKKAVNSKFQKLLQLKCKKSQEATTSPAEVISDRKLTYKTPNVMSRPDSIESARESLNSSMEDNGDYNPKHYWSGQRMVSTDSVETPRCLKSQYSLESSDGEREIIASRPAPPIPKLQPPKIELVPKNEVVIALHKISPPLQKRNAIQEFPTKGHIRKPSMDSVDSDSWIPETYRNNRSQFGLNKIEENIEPWNAKPSYNFRKLSKTKSIDIFSSVGECEKVFDDFDDVLKNVPVIPITRQIHPELSSFITEQPPRPLIKQSSLSRQFSVEIETENLNIDVNKLISQFEPNIVNTGEKIKVTAVVENNRNQSPTESPIKIPTDVILQERLLRPWENHNEYATILKTTTTVKNENIKKRPISASEWALRVKASRSLESGARGSDEIFYSFDSGNYDFGACSHPFWSDVIIVAQSRVAN